MRLQLPAAAVAVAAALAVEVLAPLALAPPAWALAPGVHVDPGSPAGKEYAFPLSVLRGNGSGHPAGGTQSPPLFGVGIRHPANRPRATGEGHRSRSDHGGRAHPGQGGGSRHRPQTSIGGKAQRTGVATAGHGGAPGRAATRQEAARLTRASSPDPQVALLGGVVLLGGAALGGLLAAIRRRRRD